MPLQNRVDPWGSLHAVASRAATTMGNRGSGVLHDEAKRIVTVQGGRAWIACAMDFKGRRRTVMGPGTYTELFFLDEATALAAGHRPCFECRRDRATEFLDRWRRLRSAADARVGDLDAVLSEQRRVPRSPLNHGKRAYRAVFGQLPVGALADVDGDAWLVTADGPVRWTFTGYDDGSARTPSSDRDCWVLTPRATVSILADGYEPSVHDSAAVG